MRPNQNAKRSRGQRRKQGGNINRALDSTGPDVKIRGTAMQIYEKYLQLSRDAQTSGDRIRAENLMQHAEHYFRIVRSLQPTPATSQPDPASADQPGASASNEDRRQTQAVNGSATADASRDAAPKAAAAESESRSERPPRRKRARRAPAETNGAEPAAKSESTDEAAPQESLDALQSEQPAADDNSDETPEKAAAG
ncbi:MAG: hypothetical protein Tsb0010_07350 [Parvularculaceae bacterium]